MLIRRILKLSQAGFASKKALLAVSQQLARLDSLKGDEICKEFMQTYHKRESIEDILKMGPIAKNINSSYQARPTHSAEKKEVDAKWMEDIER